MTNSDRSIDNSNDPTLRPDFFDLIRLPIVICVDASGSMLADGGNGVPMIKMLEDMINSIIDSSELDDDEKDAVDICILKFDETVNTVVDWIPLCHFKNKISLEAYGSTSLGEALLTAVENVHKRKYLYNSCGLNIIRPQIFVFTDAGDIDVVYEKFQSSFNDVDHSFYTKVTVFTLPMYCTGISGTRPPTAFPAEKNEERPSPPFLPWNRISSSWMNRAPIWTLIPAAR